ncbi:cellulase family glycosylhydrolase [Micromonospora craniellae]|uniref:cellulase n=1 Tax=Micromonospora craniellae TaxID=2294034 RepID=A0A372G1M0_9ACTN|nr:cellulase family glycosylhydrolase [Micromonospora craniellae]QOC92808.1 cellulase family glycosylhydrolase [Micromonospora craniellae]RFS46951.1 cellulase [Micromonospora craniellae]
MAGLRNTLRRTRWRFGLVTSGIAVLLAGVGLVNAGAAHAAAGCRVVYSAPSQWPGGFTANVDLTNLGDPVNGWRLTWTFPSGQRVTQAWNATVTSSGNDVTATNVGYNAAIGTNQSVSFGFNGSYTGTNTAPTSFALNGVTCTGSVGPTTPPPTTPPPTTPPPTTPPPTGDAMAYVAAMQPGWNLGNTLDAVGDDETAWGNPRVTAAQLDAIRAQGFNSIRLPITWSNRHGPAPSYTIDAAWLNRIKEVVGWALDDGFYVMINIHHDSWQWIHEMPTNRTTVLNRYNALWTQIAAAFRDSSPKLHFESVNEPQFANSSGDAQNAQLLHELNTSFHRIVRASGGGNATRMLVLPTLHTSSDQPRIDELVSTFTQLNDRNLIATVHFYGYWPFSVNVAGGTRFDAVTQQDLVDRFDRVHNAFVARNIPVVIGEYGLLGFDRHTGTVQQGEKLKFFEFLGHYARTKRITTQLWDNGQHFDRVAFRWKDAELFAQIKSSWTTRSGTASADQVYVPRTGSVTAKSLTLNLNGTTFSGLRQGTTNLSQGADYTVSGNQLTLTASALTRLVGSRAYGVNATLHARFSTGVPWRIDIITYDPPVLSNATGSTEAFAIPTQFRGDQLATMEAKYADGSNAGPHDWTSYKEFDVTFAPDYTGNRISLTPTFFGEVRDGAPVTLTFHFWSGAQVTYRVTKSGSSVTGVTG